MSKFLIILMIVCIIVTTVVGCNYQMIDTAYSYDYAYISYGDGTVKKVEIKSWRDYEDGEQIQVTGTDGSVYLASSFNCVLVKEGK
jgi:hypothetical protein